MIEEKERQMKRLVIENKLMNMRGKFDASVGKRITKFFLNLTEDEYKQLKIKREVLSEIEVRLIETIGDNLEGASYLFNLTYSTLVGGKSNLLRYLSDLIVRKSYNIDKLKEETALKVIEVNDLIGKNELDKDIHKLKEINRSYYLRYECEMHIKKAMVRYLNSMYFLYKVEGESLEIDKYRNDIKDYTINYLKNYKELIDEQEINVEEVDLAMNFIKEQDVFTNKKMKEYIAYGRANNILGMRSKFTKMTNF